MTWRFSDTSWSQGHFSLLRSQLLRLASSSTQADHCLDRNPSVGDQLYYPNAAPQMRRRQPTGSPDEHSGSGPGLHGGGEVPAIVGGQQLRQLSLDLLVAAPSSPISESSIDRRNRPCFFFRRDKPLQHPDRRRATASRSRPRRGISFFEAISPVKLLAPAGNSTTRQSKRDPTSRDLCSDSPGSRGRRSCNPFRSGRRLRGYAGSSFLSETM